MSSLMKNHTWELVDQPPGQKVVNCKWLYKIKEGIEGVQKPRYKARLVVRGFTQQAGIDHNELPGFEERTGNKDVERMSKVPYANVVGSLMYLMVCTRPNITYVVSIVSRYLANPCKTQWEVVKWILKFLKRTAYVGLVYGRDQGKHVDVDGFVDADYAKDPNKGRLIIGYVFMVHGCVVSWKATMQHVVALSTTEAEYMALTEAVKESIWLKGLLI
nr:retrovirus-related Pol polyprotein from transposon TNT 1-94 [Tanacetum cinerariifolium]